MLKPIYLIVDYYSEEFCTIDLLDIGPIYMNYGTDFILEPQHNVVSSENKFEKSLGH